MLLFEFISKPSLTLNEFAVKSGAPFFLLYGNAEARTRGFRPDG
jgi:hypothetical protein